MPAVFIYQILTPLVSTRDLDPGFLVLDNSENARPDWFEYWPIRQFLLAKSLDENAFYGFLSPRFQSKTERNGTVQTVPNGLASDSPDSGRMVIVVTHERLDRRDVRVAGIAEVRRHGFLLFRGEDVSGLL